MWASLGPLGETRVQAPAPQNAQDWGWGAEGGLGRGQLRVPGDRGTRKSDSSGPRGLRPGVLGDPNRSHTWVPS